MSMARIMCDQCAGEQDDGRLRVRQRVTIVLSPNWDTSRSRPLKFDMLCCRCGISHDRTCSGCEDEVAPATRPGTCCPTEVDIAKIFGTQVSPSAPLHPNSQSPCEHSAQRTPPSQPHHHLTTNSNTAIMGGVSVRDVPADKFIEAYAAFLKRQGKLPIPGP